MAQSVWPFATDWEVRGSKFDGSKMFSLLHLSIRTDPVSHPASSTTDTGVVSWGLKRPGRGVDHPYPSSAEIENEQISTYAPLRAWSLLNTNRLSNIRPDNFQFFKVKRTLLENSQPQSRANDLQSTINTSV